MAAFRKIFLALAAVAAVSSTAPLALAQSGNLTCTAGSTLPVVRVEGLTEYVGDVLITCTGGTPTGSGATVLTDNFEIDITSTNITSRLLGVTTNTANGAYPLVESLLIINEAFPLGGYQNPSSIQAPVAPPATYSITQKACPNSNSQGSCRNLGNGLGGWGTDGADDTSTYGSANSGGNYNVFQGYQYSNNALRFDGIPVDPPGIATHSGGPTPSISFRITNVRVDATPFAASTPLTSFGPPVLATLTVTGSQPLIFENLQTSSSANGYTNLTVAYTEHTLKQVTVQVADSLICQGCSVSNESSSSYVSDPYANTTFSYYVQENFASAFKAQSWFYGDTYDYSKHDPGIEIGHGALHTHSTQDVTAFAYFSESNFYPNGDNDLAGLQAPGAVGEATNGTRLVFSVNNLIPGVSLTAPAVAGLYGGVGGTTNPSHEVTIDTPSVLSGTPPPPLQTAGQSVFPTPGPSLSPVATAASGVAILLGAVTPNGGIAVDYSGSFFDFTPSDVTVAVKTANEPIQFVYEVLYADGGNIETLWVPFNVNYCSLITAPLPPPVATASVGLGPISLKDMNTSTIGDPTKGDTSYPRFLAGSNNPLASQAVWYLNNCNCDLLFPYVAATANFDTGIAISNTSADPYGTPRSVGYVQLFYYLNSLAAGTFKSPNDAYGRPLLGNDGVLAAGPGSIVGPTGGSYTVYTGGVYDPANGISARSTFQQITFNPVTAGDQFIALLSTGAWVNGSKDPGWAGTPGFEGYIFAVSGFPYCHGYAFISNYVNNQTQGYLALVVDDGGRLRRSDTSSLIVTEGYLTTDPSWKASATAGPSGGVP